MDLDFVKSQSGVGATGVAYQSEPASRVIRGQECAGRALIVSEKDCKGEFSSMSLKLRARAQLYHQDCYGNFGTGTMK